MRGRWGRVSIFLVLGFTAILGISTVLPAQRPQASPKDCSITIYVSNIENFHSEVLVPVRTSVFDWQLHFPLAPYFENAEQFKFLSFGWGDEVFFRTGSRDFRTVSRALFLPTTSVLHVSGYRTTPRQNTSSVSFRAVQINQAEYRKLVRELQNSFALTAEKQVQPIEPGLGRNSYFFQAQGKYHLFNTCNHWTARMLRRASIRTPLMPIFPQSIVHLAASQC